MAVNYIRFKQFSLLWDHYAFIDVPAYLADQLFFKHRVTVHFGEELHHPEAGYMIIFCKVRKKDSERFLDALSELPNKMLICGHPDYEEYCDDIIGGLKNTPLKKRSKKAQRTHHALKRADWNGVVPVTRMVPDKTKYDRNRMKRESND